MIIVDRYKAFRGTMGITPRTNFHEPFVLSGDFLYKPESDCWCHDVYSYSASICYIKKDETDVNEE